MLAFTCYFFLLLIQESWEYLISCVITAHFQVIPTARDLRWKVDPVHNKILKCSFTCSYVEKAQTASGLSPFEFLNRIDF